MRSNKSKKQTEKKPVRQEKDRDPHPYETMSQQQNRYGKGRERNGSDGVTGRGRGSNH